MVAFLDAVRASRRRLPSNARLLLALLALIGVTAPAPSAQQAPQPTAAASAPLTDQVPLDRAITTGTFKNGLRYFIRTTKKPEKRAELRLVVNAGSILEENDQRGLAHFVEHMAFNGTKHFPKQETVAFLESLGMRFGPSINAYTSFDETVYMLQLPTDKPEVIDRAFLILEDWAHGVTFDPAEIDKERGVIKEEWRVRRGAGARMQDKQFPVMLKGSRYAERLPIGLTEVIDNFKHERLKTFYEDWYRPDLMTVIAAGDFDVAAVEKMIAAHFEGIPARKNPRPRATYPVPDHPGTLYAIATDKEATSASAGVIHKIDLRDHRTIGSYRQRILERMFSVLLGTRFAELAQKPESPIMGANAGRGLFMRTKEASSLNALVRGDAIDRALEVLFIEAERVARFGFTPGEVQRAKTNIMTAMERAVTEKDNTPAASIANELVRHVTDREVVPGIAYELELYRRFVPEITLAELNALARDWAPDRNRVVTVNAPEKAGFAVPDEKALAAVLASIGSKEITAYVDTVDDAPLLDPLPTPGAIVSTAAKEEFGITEWQLANGVKVVLKPTTFREDEILVRGTSYGGASLASDADYVPASSSSAVVAVGGLGRFAPADLRKKMTGKTASATAFISEYEEGITGSSSRKDLEALLQLIYLRFTWPRLDPMAFSVFTTNMRSSLANQRSSPAFHFNEALSTTLRQNHVRSRPVTVETLDHLNLDKSFTFYKERFADASDFTFVFVGSFDPPAMKPLVERYLGALPSIRRKETWRDTGLRFATGVIEKRVERGIEPKSRTATVFTGTFDHSQTERVVLRALGDVLTTRLRETLREALGGTYGVNVAVSYARIPVNEYAIRIEFECAPERAAELLKAALQQVDLLKASGPSEKEVADAREKAIRDNETSTKQNAYWVAQLSLRYQSGEALGSLLRMTEYYRELTPAMIQDAAKRYLNPANRVTVTLVPEKKTL